MTPKVPISYFLLGVLTAYVLVQAIIARNWWFVGAVVFGSIHQAIVSREWWNAEKAKLRDAQQ